MTLKIAMTTLGELDADHLGRIVSVADGGSTHTGKLRNVTHSESFNGQQRTQITLRQGTWRHIQTYPSGTPCDIDLEEVTPA